MTDHVYVADPSLSIVRAPPLEDEPGLGELTISGFLRDVVSRFSGHEALVEHRPGGPILRWTYADLWAQSLAVARSLIACGLGKGDRVGVLMTNRAEFVAAVFGTALAGGVAAPISTFSTAAELEHLVASSACSVLLLEQRVLKKDYSEMLCSLDPATFGSATHGLRSLVFPFLRHIVMVDGETSEGGIESWNSFLARGEAIEEDRVHARSAANAPADPGMLFFSSGSTSKPKGILSAHRGVAIQMWRMRRQQGLDEGVRSWTANGFFWSGNFAMIVGATLAAGGTLVLQRTFQAEEALTLMEAERVTFLFCWPHQWAQLESAANWADIDLSALVQIDVDSPVARHPTVTTRWVEPRHAYGNTETFTLIAGYPAGTSREDAGDSHGLPFPGNRLKIVHPLTGTSVPVGTRGEIAVKGPTLMLGYVGIPLDQSVDEQGYFRTGDGGYVDGEGRLFWEGRLNDIIKTGGANVSPVEIDSIVQDCPGVKLSQTVGIPDDLLGERVVTCVVRHDGTEIDEQAVRAFARERLASYKVPRHVLFFAETELQMTGSAKVKTSDLRALVADRLKAAG